MEGILVAQQGKLISPDYKLTNMKNDIGKILCGRGTYRSKLLPPYIPGILSSTIISEQWLIFVNEEHHSASRQKPQTLGIHPAMTILLTQRSKIVGCGQNQ